MLISFIVPAYNAQKYIYDCLTSISSQGFPAKEYEIIVVNDGSTDNSVFEIERFRKDNPDVTLKLINQQNKGQSAARNAGIEAADGRYLWFIDADDFIIPHSIPLIYSVLCLGGGTQHDIDILTFNLIGGDPEKIDTLQSQETKSVKCSNPMSGIEYIARYNYNNSPAYYLTDREFLNGIDLRFAEGKLCEDGIFTAELFLNARTMIHTDIDAYFYATRPGSTTTTVNPQRQKMLLDGFINAISHFSTLITHVREQILGVDTSSDIREKCIERLTNRQASYIFFFFIRLLKSGNYKLASQQIALYRKEGIYPIRHDFLVDYPGKFKYILGAMNRRRIFISLCKAMALKKSIKK